MIIINNKKEFLIEEGYDFVYLPSASVLKFINKNKVDGKSLVMGNPTYPKSANLDNLESAEKESKDIASILKAKILLNDKATESYFKENSDKYNMIFLSTHAELFLPDPMESKIWLADDKKNDG